MKSLLFLGLISSAAFASDVTVKMMSATGASLGTVTITEMKNGVKLSGDLHGLTAGPHALHFHENGKCVGPKFESAGGHFAPTHNKHGFDMEGGFHAGDMPNFDVAADGTSKFETVDTQVSMGSGANSLLKSGGTALVIHEKADDYKSQPAGDAGSRVACGVITK